MEPAYKKKLLIGIALGVVILLVSTVAISYWNSSGSGTTGNDAAVTVDKKPATGAGAGGQKSSVSANPTMVRSKTTVDISNNSDPENHSSVKNSVTDGESQEIHKSGISSENVTEKSIDTSSQNITPVDTDNNQSPSTSNSAAPERSVNVSVQQLPVTFEQASGTTDLNRDSAESVIEVDLSSSGSYTTGNDAAVNKTAATEANGQNSSVTTTYSASATVTDPASTLTMSEGSEKRVDSDTSTTTTAPISSSSTSNNNPSIAVNVDNGLNSEQSNPLHPDNSVDNNPPKYPEQEASSSPSTTNVKHTRSDMVTLDLITAPIIDPIGSEHTHKYYSGLLSGYRDVKYGAFDIKFTSQGPAVYRVFYVSNGTRAEIAKIISEITESSIDKFELTALFPNLEMHPKQKPNFYKTMVPNEKDESSGLSIEEMSRQIHYSGLDKCVENMSASELNTWINSNVFLIVPSAGTNIEEYHLLNSNIEPVTSVIRSKTESRFYKLSWKSKYDHFLKITKIENVFGLQGKMALKIDFSLTNEVIEDAAAAPYKSLISYEMKYGKIQKNELHHDGLAVFYTNSSRTHAEKVLDSLKTKGLVEAFDFHYKSTLAGFSKLGIILIGDKEILKNYTKMEEGDALIEL